jgi:hypothetical protein
MLVVRSPGLQVLLPSRKNVPISRVGLELYREET